MKTQLFFPQYMEVCLVFPFNWCQLNKSEQKDQKKPSETGTEESGARKMTEYAPGYGSRLLGSCAWDRHAFAKMSSFLEGDVGSSV